MMRLILPLAALVLVGCQSTTHTSVAKIEPVTFLNPIKIQGADPWMQHVDGRYYLATTTGREVKLRHAARIGDLKDAPDIVVWKDDAPERSQGVWAPEFHHLDNGDGTRKWYLYVTAFDGKNDADHRMFVAESTTDSVMGPYVTKTKLNTDPKDAFYAIDGTVLTWTDGSLYFVWCGRPSPSGQGLYIAKMSNPWTIVGERKYIDVDGFGCAHIREGPVFLYRNGRVFLIYSMCSADTPDYRLGMLIADETADPMDLTSWKQHPRPVFERDNEVGVYGPGHNYFFKSPDGAEDWTVYHAKTTTRITYGDRTARAQKFTWNADGTPNFGKPIPTDTPVPVPSGEPASDPDQPAPPSK